MSINWKEARSSERKRTHDTKSYSVRWIKPPNQWAKAEHLRRQCINGNRSGGICHDLATTIRLHDVILEPPWSISTQLQRKFRHSLDRRATSGANITSEKPTLWRLTIKT
ncbi:hypothetical protein H5410_003047 [Solanum commersonii]|uniref:Uncharacterized protein n=1 Tax=Solanum commersonii TaxID=4109 RepID=A0A9J6B416_SOLCO|nr:hypothetical protein H5410_003047 [Solanum commersonii]